MTAPWMDGSNSGSREKVFAKHPFSVPNARPPGISPTKSSWTGFDPFWVVNVVVVFPVPESPMIMNTLSPVGGITFSPACSASPPRS